MQLSPGSVCVRRVCVCAASVCVCARVCVACVQCVHVRVSCVCVVLLEMTQMSPWSVTVFSPDGKGLGECSGDFPFVPVRRSVIICYYNRLYCQKLNKKPVYFHIEVGLV